MKKTRVWWRAGTLWTVLALWILGAAACGSLLPRDQGVQPLPRQQTAERVTVVDRNGPVSAATEARELARVKAEGSGALMERHLGVLAAKGDTQLMRGNTAKLLIDGPRTFAAMKAAIAAAKHRLLVEFYIVEDEGVAAEVADMLIRKAGEGVHVAFLYDAVGSLGSDRAFFDRLRDGGVAVCAFNPINPLERPGHWGLTHRNHRKMLAADSDVAFTGGINLSNVYAEGSFGSGRRVRPPSDAEKRGWRDTQVEVRGPVVNALAAEFRESWSRQGCEGTLPPAPPPQVATPGQRVIKLVAGDPDKGVNPTYTALLRAIDASQRSIQLTMAYFAPGDQLIQALCDAAQRGVAVSLVLPGRSDVKLVMHAARARYAQLMEAGVQIYEMKQSVMHAKTAVIDGVFSSVGSSNLDWRSIVGNNEMDLIVLGEDFGEQMQALFKRDVAASTAIEAAQWSQRGIGQRFMERFARWIEPLL
ncbi:phosphatidylserine/phosphatidylglycerophosphate/cardiolipin synthase family protein [Roseateles sp. DC23W]|uniref:Phosphatidylserine/phosphatidylglycerophosphate/ cardiolipin synthase family protein n=1 Tax=Pelomonas dachongensis TaxID=3299029 RepID=A0ABW7ESR1_9BURK